MPITVLPADYDPGELRRLREVERRLRALLERGRRITPDQLRAALDARPED